MTAKWYGRGRPAVSERSRGKLVLKSALDEMDESALESLGGWPGPSAQPCPGIAHTAHTSIPTRSRIADRYACARVRAGMPRPPAPASLLRANALRNLIYLRRSQGKTRAARSRWYGRVHVRSYGELSGL